MRAALPPAQRKANGARLTTENVEDAAERAIRDELGVPATSESPDRVTAPAPVDADPDPAPVEAESAPAEVESAPAEVDPEPVVSRVDRVLRTWETGIAMGVTSAPDDRPVALVNTAREVVAMRFGRATADESALVGVIRGVHGPPKFYLSGVGWPGVPPDLLDGRFMLTRVELLSDAFEGATVLNVFLYGIRVFGSGVMPAVSAYVPAHQKGGAVTVYESAHSSALELPARLVDELRDLVRALQWDSQSEYTTSVSFDLFPVVITHLTSAWAWTPGMGRTGRLVFQKRQSAAAELSVALVRAAPPVTGFGANCAPTSGDSSALEAMWGTDPAPEDRSAELGDLATVRFTFARVE